MTTVKNGPTVENGLWIKTKQGWKRMHSPANTFHTTQQPGPIDFSKVFAKAMDIASPTRHELHRRWVEAGVTTWPEGHNAKACQYCKRGG